MCSSPGGPVFEGVFIPLGLPMTCPRASDIGRSALSILVHLANAAGLSSSPYFDAEGNYTLKLRTFWGKWAVRPPTPQPLPLHWGALLNSPLTVNRFRPRGAVVSVLQKKKGTWTMLMRDRLRKRTGTARKSRRQSLLVRGFWQCVTRLPRQSRSFIGRRLAVMSACFAEWATKWAPWRHGMIER